MYSALNYNNNSNHNPKDVLVVNLSDYQLSKPEGEVLARVPIFCPTPGEPDFGELRCNLNSFHLRIKHKHFFNSIAEEKVNDVTNFTRRRRSDDEPFGHPKFKEPSKWAPLQVTNLEVFIKENEMDLLKHSIPSSKGHNLSKDDVLAMRTLKGNPNIVIKPADKGGAMVVLNTLDYINEGLRQLSDTKFYIETTDDLSGQHQTTINQFLKKMNEDTETDDNCLSYVLVKKLRTSQFYMLPKIHKRLDNPPGRPIVSGNGCPTEKISQFVEHFLQPTVKCLPSYVRDTTYFLSKINDITNLPANSILVTMDVASLYTNIPNDGGLLATKTVLDNYRMGRQRLMNLSLCNLLEMALTMNNFDFGGRHYLQVGGTAMGTKVAPSFANTYMGWFEDRFVHTYPLQPLIWVRFIDDIFQIWTHGAEEFKKFEHHLNHCIDSIKFKTDTSTESVHSLDVTVSLTDTGNINTSLYTKPTDTRNYLSHFSCHPRNCRYAIPYSQFLRVRRICNDTDDFVVHARSLAQDFLRAKYPRDIIQKAFVRAFELDRDDLLKPKFKGEKDEKDNIFLITTHHPGGRLLNDIIQQNWDILDGSSTVPKWKVTQGFRRPKDVRDQGQVL